MTVGNRHGTDQHAVGRLQIPNGGPFRKELRVGKNVEFNSARIGLKNPVNRFRGTNRKRAFFHNDLGGICMFGDQTRTLFPVLEIGGFAGSGAESLRRRIHAHKDDIGVFDSLNDIRGEKEISVAPFLHNVQQPRLVDRQGIRVPARNALLIDIRHSHGVVRAFRRNHRHRRPADISGAYAKNGFLIHPQQPSLI